VAATIKLKHGWDDNEFPLAIFITFRTYGSWLPGDDRGTVDRYHNVFRGPKAEPNPVFEKQNARKLKSDPVTLNRRQRATVEKAVREVCAYRGWTILALNIRTNHVHIVVSIGTSEAEAALRDLKSYSTRALRKYGQWVQNHSPWVDGGSTRYLWNERSVTDACDYVINRQGPDLSEF
jgi:REP element-mobilizing transposase RayT